MSPEPSATTHIRCHNCRHYFVTWEPARPHGCRLMGFKSHKLPSMVVYQHSSAPCKGFEHNQKPNTPTKGNHDT